MNIEYLCASDFSDSAAGAALPSPSLAKNTKTASVSWKLACLAVAFCVAGTMGASAQTFKTLVNFNESNGAYPQWGALAQGLNGELYGTTSGGGLFRQVCFLNPDSLCGTIYKVTADGTLTIVHDFTDDRDGSGPSPGLVLDASGFLYGSNANGGDRDFCFGFGCGAIFTMSQSGGLKTLYDFNDTDAANSTST